MPSRLCVPPGGGREFYSVQGAGCDQLVDILLIGWWWGNWESASWPFWFQPVWSGVYMLVGSGQLTSSTWWGIQYLQNSSKDRAQNIIYSPWGRTKGPWLCLMAKVLLFCLAWLFSFLSAFSHFSDWFYSLTKFFLQTKGRQRTWMGSVLGRSHSVLLGYIRSRN